MPTRADLKAERERGLTPEEQAAQNLARLTLAAATAFGAATLVEAQEALAAVVPSLATSMSLSAGFDSPSGASPQTTATRTITVPAGNPGSLRIAVTVTASATVEYSLNGAAGVAITITSELRGNAIVSVANGDTLAITGSAGPDSITLDVRDQTTNASMSTSTISLTS
jgi:hypothetical protein